MPRYLYMRFLAIAAIGAAAFLVYRTEPAAPLPAVAEFGGVSLRIEYATTETERERGLGGRESIPSDYGMLFVFPENGLYGFWMKDTLVPLDIFWLDSKGQVVSIQENVQPSSYPDVFYPLAPARYVLETAAGFARAHELTTDAQLRLKNFPGVSK